MAKRFIRLGLEIDVAGGHSQISGDITDHFWRQDLNLVRLPISPSSRYPQTAKLRLHSKDRNSTMPRVFEDLLGLVEQSYRMDSNALAPS